MSEGNKKDTAPKQSKAKAMGVEVPGPCCAAIREMLSKVGDKWSVLTISLLSDGPLRFNELRRRNDGISQRMLTRTLRELERDGLVKRTVTPSTPPSVEYELTDLGFTLLEPVRNFIIWTQKNHPQILEAQKRFDRAIKVAK